MMYRYTSLVLLAGCLAFGTFKAWSHHAFSAEFDADGFRDIAATESGCKMRRHP